MKKKVAITASALLLLTVGTSALVAAQTYSRSPSSFIKYNKTDESSSVFSLPFFPAQHFPYLHPLLAHTPCFPFPASENVACTHLSHSLIQERINLF